MALAELAPVSVQGYFSTPKPKSFFFSKERKKKKKKGGGMLPPFNRNCLCATVTDCPPDVMKKHTQCFTCAYLVFAKTGKKQ